MLNYVCWIHGHHSWMGPNTPIRPGDDWTAPVSHTQPLHRIFHIRNWTYSARQMSSKLLFNSRDPAVRLGPLWVNYGSFYLNPAGHRKVKNIENHTNLTNDKIKTKQSSPKPLLYPIYNQTTQQTDWQLQSQTIESELPLHSRLTYIVKCVKFNYFFIHSISGLLYILNFLMP